MKKIINSLWLLSILFLPTMVYAYNDFIYYFPLPFALIMEVFITIHMSLFFLLPLSKIKSKDNSKKTFWKMFWTRVIVLLIGNLIISPAICIIDFFMVFIGAFVIVPIASRNKNNEINEVNDTDEESEVGTMELKCSKCGSIIQPTDMYCGNCGNPCNTIGPKNFIKYYEIDPMYKKSDDGLLEDFILKELDKAGVDISSSLIPGEILRRKKIMLIIFSVLVFVYISLIFFHFPFLTYFVGLIILIVLFICTNRYNLMKYLKKEIKARPNEKISNIVMNTKSSFMADDSRRILIVGVIAAVVISLFTFINPRIMYEKVTYNNVEGYAVRFYTFGLTNFTSAVIPESHKGLPVISLRGNTFSNMPFLKSIDLPDTILEIRGQAFKNDIILKSIKLPKKLEYLGGGAFYNCFALESIELPDTLTYMGGEAFFNAYSLKSVKLSNELKEIRGSSFEECSKLESISIPDKVVRIGGHAFYGCSNLSKVEIREKSELKEIGSSAFRRCSNLKEIVIPRFTIFNEKAFKESPTEVYRIGELRYGSIIDKTKYLHNLYKNLYLNEYKEITYNTNSLVYNHKIGLDNISCYNGECVYTIIYDDGVNKKSVVLTKDKPYEYITNNLAIEISSEYYLDNQTKAAVIVYFN